LLKEKQERRKAEREEEERQMAEKKRADEERRKAEEDARKAKAEAEKQRKEEEKQRKAAVMGGIPMGGQAGGPNYVIDKNKASQFDKFGNIMTAKMEMGQSREQHEDVKKKALAEICKPLETSGLDINGLRAKVKDLHARICKLEALKYDLEERQGRQEYDLKELTERQRQINRNKALKKGIEPDAEGAAGRHPPKVAVASKYDRQVDRRTYTDRREIFEFPPKPKRWTIFHGTGAPPAEWGRRKDHEELENIRKILEPPKYQEVVKIEGARPEGVVPIPAQIPDKDELSGDEAEEE
jgi:troponin T